jgi:hypothetical protein
MNVKTEKGKFGRRTEAQAIKPFYFIREFHSRTLTINHPRESRSQKLQAGKRRYDWNLWGRSVQLRGPINAARELQSHPVEDPRDRGWTQSSPRPSLRQPLLEDSKPNLTWPRNLLQIFGPGSNIRLNYNSLSSASALADASIATNLRRNVS